MIDKKKLMSKEMMIVLIIVIIIWTSLFLYMIKYGKDVRADPCSVCAKRIGEEVKCYYGDFNAQEVVFFPNMTIRK